MVCGYHTVQHCSRLYPWIAYKVMYLKCNFGVTAVAYVKGKNSIRRKMIYKDSAIFFFFFFFLVFFPFLGPLLWYMEVFRLGGLL